MTGPRPPWCSPTSSRARIGTGASTNGRVLPGLKVDADSRNIEELHVEADPARYKPRKTPEQLEALKAGVAQAAGNADWQPLPADVMPKIGDGAWMDTVKQAFGILMLGVAIWMVSRKVRRER